jgi:hypothetical protein
VLGRHLGLIAAALLGIGCGSHVAPSEDDRGMLIPACSWPAAADTSDPTTRAGCQPRSIFQLCEVPNGSYIHADGTITTPDGTTVTCDSACGPTDYAMFCRSETPSIDPPTSSPMPTPDPSLGCRILPIPTPPSLTVYCCACGAGG